MASAGQRTLTPALPLCHLTLTASIPTDPWYPDQLGTIGDHIRRKRLNDGLLQRELAELLGVDKTTVSLWERNRVEPGVEKGATIIRYLGYNPMVDDAEKDLGERLRAYRWTHGLTQRAFADEFGVAECTIRAWESGRTHPAKRHVLALSALTHPHLQRS